MPIILATLALSVALYALYALSRLHARCAAAEAEINDLRAAVRVLAAEQPPEVVAQLGPIWQPG